jgi:hypothetical protein
MSTVIPMHGAGEFTLTETRVNIYSALGSLRVKSAPDYAVESFGALEVSGEGLDASHEAWDVRGDVLIPAVSALDAGELPDSKSLGSLVEGRFEHDPALGAAEVSGELDKPALGLLEVGAPGGFTGTTEYGSLASLGASTSRHDPALGSSEVAGQSAHTAPIGLLVRTDRNSPAQGTLETGQAERSKPALSSLETALFVDDVSTGALEVQDGDSVDFVVDIQDEILSTGHGDC